MTLGLLWWSYAKGHLGLRAVRAGLALQELKLRRAAHAWTERKRGRRPEFSPHFSVQELAALCGLPPKRARAALKELQALGYLVEFSPGRIVLASTLEDLSLPPEDLAEFRSWFDRLTRRKRVPVPRRILALAVEASSPALIATVLGVCLRCCWKRPEGFSFTGRISCPWLASRFSVSLRAIQQAKSLIVGLKWISHTGNINRFGETLVINPEWHRIAATNEAARLRAEGAGGAGGETSEEIDGTKPAGVPAPGGTNPAGFSLTRESPPEEIQRPRQSRPEGRADEPGPGISISREGEKNKDQDPPRPEIPAPRLSSIRPEDFRDIGRALELFRQAVQCGLMANASEHSRLLWLAAIERARTVPARNPAGVFLYLVKNRRWNFLSDGHFEGANSRLKAYLHGPRAEMPPLFIPRSIAPPSRPRLSKDALLVQAVRNELARKGYRGELFPALRVHAGFSRERYETAVAELENCQPSAANAV